MPQRYDLEKIKALLTEIFTDEELRRFCYDTPEFIPVYEQLRRDTRKAQVIHQLINYANQNSQLGTLLNWAKTHNSIVYEKYQPYYDFSGPTLEPIVTSSASEPVAPNDEMGARTKKTKIPSSLRIFLCHASEDKEAVRDLYRRLQADGFEPWLDEEDLLPGQVWRREIPNAVRSSDAVLVCLSNHAITKDGYVRDEIAYALDVAEQRPNDAIFIIPVKLESLEDGDIPVRLRRWQWVNLFEETGYDRLVRALQVGVQLLRKRTTLKGKLSQTIRNPVVVGLLISVFSCIAAWLALPQIQNFISVGTGASTPTNISASTTLASSTATATPTLTPANTPTDTVTPTQTPPDTPTHTPEPTLTPTPTETPTPENTGPRVTASNGAVNLRLGPGTSYEAVGVLPQGQSVEIVGRNENFSWWQVSTPNGLGWVTASVTTAANVDSSIPVVAAPPPPTHTPTPIVCPEPRLVGFTPPETSIKPGDEITLKWRIEGADHIGIEYIENGELKPVGLEPEGAWSHSPEQTTTYKLVATYCNDKKKELREITVEVSSPSAPTPTQQRGHNTRFASGRTNVLKTTIRNYEFHWWSLYGWRDYFGGYIHLLENEDSVSITINNCLYISREKNNHTKCWPRILLDLCGRC